MTRRAHFTRARPERKRHEDRLRQLNACACDCTHVCVRVGAPGDHRMEEIDRQMEGKSERERGGEGRERILSLGMLPKDLLPQKYLITTLPVV